MAYNATYNHSNASNLHTPYQSNPSPYGSGDPYYNESTGFITPNNPKKGRSKWVKIGIPVAVVLVAAAIAVGVFFGIGKNNTKSSSSNSGTSSNSGSSADDGTGMLATATDSLYLLPIYPSTVSVDIALLSRFWSQQLVKLAWRKTIVTTV